MLTISGPDRPGLGAAAFALLAPHSRVITDVGQITIRGHLVLCIEVEPASGVGLAELRELALHLREGGHQPLLVAADLQRPNAVDQLTVVAERAGVAVHAPEPGNGVGDPVAVARGGVELARTKLYDVVIVDTAGRLAIDADLMDQLVQVRDAVQPDEVLLVIDAMIGLRVTIEEEVEGLDINLHGETVH